MNLIPLVAVVGPTASGKTRLAIDIALKYRGEVVSADSMQIYKKMDIGTAKPSKKEMRGVPHHMIDIIEPHERYSVAQYVTDAKKCIEEIYTRGNLPVLAGGTGLYVSSLVDNISFSETVRNDKLREQLAEIAAEQGGEALLNILREFDPNMAEQLHPNNTGRIIRAIEVYRTTGVTMTETQIKSRQTEPIYKLCMIGLNFPNRADLYRRIDMRVDMMLKMGLVHEVENVLRSGITREETAMQAIGYKEIAAALNGMMTMDEAIDKVKRESRRYAKRQLTWFRRDKRIRWIEADMLYENICQKAYGIIDNCGLV